MRICLIGTLPTGDEEVRSGPERTTIGLAESLEERGHDVTVLSDEGSSETVRTVAKVLPISSPPGVRRLVEFAWRARTVINAESFDVVHSWRSVPGSDVLSLHSIGMATQVEERLPGTFSRRFRAGARIERFAKRLTAEQVDCTVVTAPANARDAKRFGFDVETIVPVGVSKRFLQPDRAGGGPDVLCAGRLEPRKQQHFVAVETPEKYELQLAGPCSNRGYAERIPDLRASWEGKLSTAELLSAYQTASVFVLPSVFEGFGLTAVEAMASGCPVVVADTCGVSDFVDENQLGSVYQFGDGESYREALEEVMTERDSYSRRARAFVERKLLWPEIASSYEDIYDTVIS